MQSSQVWLHCIGYGTIRTMHLQPWKLMALLRLPFSQTRSNLLSLSSKFQCACASPLTSASCFDFRHVEFRFKSFSCARFVNLEPEIFFGSLLPEVAVVGKIRPSAAMNEWRQNININLLYLDSKGVGPLGVGPLNFLNQQLLPHFRKFRTST